MCCFIKSWACHFLLGFFSEPPAARDHVSFKRWVGRISEGTTEIENGGGWRAQRSCATTHREVLWNGEGTGQVLPSLIRSCLTFLLWTLTSAHQVLNEKWASAKGSVGVFHCVVISVMLPYFFTFLALGKSETCHCLAKQRLDCFFGCEIFNISVFFMPTGHW